MRPNFSPPVAELFDVKGRYGRAGSDQVGSSHISTKYMKTNIFPSVDHMSKINIKRDKGGFKIHIYSEIRASFGRNHILTEKLACARNNIHIAVINTE